MRNAACFASRLRVAAFRVSASDVGLGVARGAAFAGCVARTFSTFMSQLGGQFSWLLTESLPRDTAAGHVTAAEESSGAREMEKRGQMFCVC